MRNPYWNCKVDLSGEATNPGERFARIFEPYFDGSTTCLREIGKKDIQASMDALAPYSDISYMLSQLKVGDTSVLSSRDPLYGDFTGLPNNPAEVINLVSGAESSFGQLSQADRAKYNNDWRLWFADLIQPRDSSGAADVSVPAVDSVVDKPVPIDTPVKEVSE